MRSIKGFTAVFGALTLSLTFLLVKYSYAQRPPPPPPPPPPHAVAYGHMAKDAHIRHHKRARLSDINRRHHKDRKNQAKWSKMAKKRH